MKLAADRSLPSRPLGAQPPAPRRPSAARRRRRRGRPGALADPGRGRAPRNASSAWRERSRSSAGSRPPSA